MSKTTRIAAWVVCLVTLTAVHGLPQPLGFIPTVDALLDMHTMSWTQYEPFNLLMPRFTSGKEAGTHKPLGCTSAAYAMILWYDKLQPHGCQSYSWVADDGQRYTVAECFNYTFNWNLIDGFNAAYQGTPGAVQTTEQILETALFCYQVAEVIGKAIAADEGYASVDQVAQLMEHFSCEAELCSVGLDGHTLAERQCLEDFITRELDWRRPLWLGMQGCQTRSYKITIIGDGTLTYNDYELCKHAMVIDGYGWLRDELWVHIMNLGPNIGGWYYLWDDIYCCGCPWGNGSSLCDGNDHRKVVAVRPPIFPPTEVHVETPYVIATRSDKAIWKIIGLEVDPPPGPDEEEYEYEPKLHPIPAAICVQGFPLSFDFALVDPLTGSKVHDSTTNLSLVRINEGAPNAILLWDLFSFDPAEGRYTFLVNTADLAPGIYDFYIATSHAARACFARIQVIAPVIAP